MARSSCYAIDRIVVPADAVVSLGEAIPVPIGAGR